MIVWRRRQFRFPRYIGAAYWTTVLFIFGFAAFNSGVGWGLFFGAWFVVLLAVFLWWYGLLPRPHRQIADRQ